MPRNSILFGALLIIVGIVGYVQGAMNDRSSVTALIPAFFGIVLLLLGVFARMNDGLRKHLMHAAAAVALIGFLATAGRLVLKFSELTMSPAVVSQAVTAVLCLIFVVLAIGSFRSARAERQGR